MRIYPFVFMLVLLSNGSFSQEIKTIKNVSGEYILSNKSDLSLKDAFSQAVIEAKLNALRKAGVVENISSSDILISSETGSEHKQDINSVLSVEISGAVLNDTIIGEKTSVNQFGNTVIQVIINAQIIKYEHKSDQSFDFIVEGVKESYENNDLMKFSFLPYSDGYLTIFALNDEENYVLFPYQNKENRHLNDSINVRFKANQKRTFPVNKLMGNPSTNEIGYILSTEQRRERNSLIFVFTKEVFPIMQAISFKNINYWIYSITPDKRRVKYYDFVINRR